MKITIIGGNGHVGRFLTQTLRERGHHVLVADQNITEDTDDQVTVNALSATQISAAIADADLVVHMAVVTLRSPEMRADPDGLARAYAVNVGSVVTCLEQCRTLGVPMVHISSMSVFADYGLVPVDPAGRGDETDYYGFTKRLAEFACHEYADQFGMRITTLRLAFPTPDDNAPQWLKPNNEGVVQLRMNDGTPVRALPSTELAAAIEDCLQMPAGHRVLAVTGGPETLLRLG